MDPYDLIPPIRGLSLLAHFRDLSIAYGFAFLIGWNREREERSAGLRTFPLVAVAACAFTQAALEVLGGNTEGLGAAVQGIVTGIGFIGGGAILKGQGEVHGTATAASLWATGAIGIAVGFGLYDIATVTTVFTAATLYLVSALKGHGR